MGNCLKPPAKPPAKPPKKDNTQNICIICMEHICDSTCKHPTSPNKIDNEPYVLACLHTFHAKCIRRWIRVKSQCPVCRVSIQQCDNKQIMTSRRHKRAFTTTDISVSDVTPARFFDILSTAPLLHTGQYSVQNNGRCQCAEIVSQENKLQMDEGDFPEYVHLTMSGELMLNRRACHRSATMWI